MAQQRVSSPARLSRPGRDPPGTENNRTRAYSLLPRCQPLPSWPGYGCPVGCASPSVTACVAGKPGEGVAPLPESSLVAGLLVLPSRLSGIPTILPGRRLDRGHCPPLRHLLELCCTHGSLCGDSSARHGHRRLRHAAWTQGPLLPSSSTFLIPCFLQVTELSLGTPSGQEGGKSGKLLSPLAAAVCLPGSPSEAGVLSPTLGSMEMQVIPVYEPAFGMEVVGTGRERAFRVSHWLLDFLPSAA